MCSMNIVPFDVINNITRMQQNEDNFLVNRNHLFKIDDRLIFTEDSK